MKYADRGLVKSGNISNLYNQLYLVFSTTFTIALGLLTLGTYFKKSKKSSLSLILCVEKKYSELSLKNFLIGRFLALVASSTCLILYYSSKIYVKGKKNGKNLPKLFGNYPRNLLTFKQTAIYSIIISSLGSLGKLIAIISHNYLHLEASQLRKLQLLIHVGLCLHSFGLVLFLHHRVSIFSPRTKMITRNFYTRHPDIVPRRDTIIDSNDNSVIRVTNRSININIYTEKPKAKITSYKKSKLIFVKPLKNQS